MKSLILKNQEHSSASLDTSYQKTILPNGITVVTEEIPYVLSISIGVWVNVGSRDESDTNNGISHFVEHMVFKGTKHFDAQGIAQSMESVGGYLNAFTSKEHTCFYARTLDKHIARAVEVLSDMVQFPLFDEKEMKKEKQVVIEEIKNIEDDPDDLIHDYFERSIYPKHSLGYPVIGTPENIEGMTKGKLFSHLQKFYTPEKMIVSAAGNLKHSELIKLVEKHFKTIQHRNGKSQRSQTSRQLKAGVQRYEKPITQAHVCLGTHGLGVKDKQRYPMLVLNTLLGEGMSSRLFQNIREKYGFAYTVYSFASFLSDAGSFGVYVGTDKNNVNNCIELIYKELNKLKLKPVSRDEIKRTKEQLKGSMMLSLENMSSRMLRLGSGELYFGKLIPLSDIVKKIDAVNVDQIQDVANKIFDTDKFATIIFNPADKSKLN